MNTHTAVSHILSETGPILLDFDGPVCGVFAGYSATAIAEELRSLIRANGVIVPESIASETDPLQVLHWTMSIPNADVIGAVEGALCAAEMRAVESATPTPFAREVIVAAHEAGRAVAIVSNNSARAITAYLTAHRLVRYVAPIVGRTHGRPDLMKPNPEPILRAVRDLGVDPQACVLVGDSVTDVTGSRAAHVRMIGYANRPAKVSRLTDAGADTVVTSMSELATPLLDSLPG